MKVGHGRKFRQRLHVIAQGKSDSSLCTPSERKILYQIVLDMLQDYIFI